MYHVRQSRWSIWWVSHSVGTSSSCLAREVKRHAPETVNAFSEKMSNRRLNALCVGRGERNCRTYWILWPSISVVRFVKFWWILMVILLWLSGKLLVFVSLQSCQLHCIRSVKIKKSIFGWFSFLPSGLWNEDNGQVTFWSIPHSQAECIMWGCEPYKKVFSRGRAERGERLSAALSGAFSLFRDCTLVMNEESSIDLASVRSRVCTSRAEFRLIELKIQLETRVTIHASFSIFTSPTRLEKLKKLGLIKPD